ncbi:hypothetical protein vBAspABolek_34 [Aeromonas phage vB_AspA_Bolek]|nr:hypothetical protein vBAspABolek_34 [Aeromonas phage vB_AspA_Bolek]
MDRHNEPDDVFVWGWGWHLTWCYREEWDPTMGDNFTILQTETPEWVAFMENEA